MKDSKRRPHLGVAVLLAAVAVGMAIAVNAPGSSDHAAAAAVQRENLQPKSGVWRGQTSQGYPVRFRVKPHLVGKAVFTVDTGSCRITYPRGINDWDRAGVRSWFYLFGAGTDFFTGKFISRTRARGDAQASNDDAGCGGKFVHWTAHFQP